MRILTLRLILGVLLAIHAHAAPIAYQQVSGQIGQSSQQPKSEIKIVNPQTIQTNISESGDHPEFVRLADGRIVPYGPGVVCTDDCVQSEAFGPDDPIELRTSAPRLTPWVLAVPAIAGGLVAFALLRPGTGGVVLSSFEPPRAILPTTPTEIPEPATLMLLGLGLALMARHGLGKKKDSNE